MKLILKKVRVHNLKDVDLTLENQQFIVFTGVSGSGKSSLAFDTIYAEGQRRYIESLSHQQRRHLKELGKPDAEKIEGISPSIAIEQKRTSKTPRSTVGTMTGIYDHLRVLFARVATPYCPVSKEPLTNQSREKIIETILAIDKGTKLIFLAPYIKSKKGELKEELKDLLKRGYFRLKIDGKIVENEEGLLLDKTTSHSVELLIDRVVIGKTSEEQIISTITSCLELGKGVFSVLDKESEQEKIFSEFAFSEKADLSYDALQPYDFSFNHPLGMCSHCHGLGESQEFSLDKIIDPEKSIEEDCCKISSSYQTIYYKNVYNNLAKLYDFKVKTPWKKLPEKAKKIFLYGIDKKWVKMRFTHPVKKKSWIDYVAWKGVIYEAYEKYKKAKSESYKKKIEEVMCKGTCRECSGARIKPYPAAAKLSGVRLQNIVSMTIEEAKLFFQNLKLNKIEEKIAKDLLQEIRKRIDFLLNVGLDYLNLDRTAPTLSGGESQRVRLASQIGSGLVGTTYVLDEPSIGLHTQDHKLLIKTLKELQLKGNTIICVEHDPDMMMAADTIVDIGPFAGKKGGEVIFCGDYDALIKDPDSLTGSYLSEKRTIAIPKEARKLEKKLTLYGCSEHNLKNVKVDIPLEGLVCITGVSGSGKSSLVTSTLFPALSNLLSTSKLKEGKHEKIEGIDHLDKVICIDQSPIGKTRRSNLATYVKLLDDIRQFFSGLPESKLRGYIPGHFSFNVKEGSCPYCKGLGKVTIDMDFLEDREVECSQCKGKRYAPEILSVQYKEKSIDDVLKMDVDEALNLFENIPPIKRKLFFLSKIGLGYIPLGQSSTTLSGGEAQRIKLAKQLIRPSTHKTLFILDEPSTGLHFYDLEKLIKLLNELVDQKNTVIVIEHNLDIIKTADWIIDIGPKSGMHGGEIIAEGPLEKILKTNTPTAIALKDHLSKKRIEKKIKAKERVSEPPITIEKACQNNLKSQSLTLKKNQIIAFCGPSGSGKSSLAFDTIFAEGQRRYIETLPPFMRQYVEMMPKAKVEKIEGLCPAIAIEQKSKGHNPRSTVGTLTEVYDLFRVLYAHMGIAYCPQTQEKIQTISKEYVVNKILSSYQSEKIYILSPLTILPHDSFEKKLEDLSQKGFLRIRLNGTYYELDEKIPYEKHKKNALYLVVDRLLIKNNSDKRLYESIEIASQLADKTFLIAREKEDLFYNLSFAVEKTGKSYPPITPQTFSFNSEEGMCVQCQGLGTVFGVDFSKIENFEKKSILKVCHLLFSRNEKFIDLVHDLFDFLDINVRLPLSKLDKKDRDLFIYGSDEPVLIDDKVVYWKGIDPVLAKAAKSMKGPPRFFLRNLMKDQICPSCKGSRLNPLSTNVRLNDVSIVELCSFPISKTLSFIKKIKIPPDYLNETLEQMIKNLSFLVSIGLDYLSLDRKTPTLSGGELQRIKLAQQLGSSLHSCLYILDEPTIGLHPDNTKLLLKALLQLKEHNNTLLIVEHDPTVLKKADTIVDFGPGAGIQGGKITSQGSYKKICSDKNSLTGAYLSGRKKIALPKKRRTSKTFLSIENAKSHNLKNLSLQIPLNTFTCICGVSGSGKSSLLFDLIKPAAKESRFREDKIILEKGAVEGFLHLNQLICIDQSPIGQNIRSDVSTYSETLPLIRSFFASLSLSKMHGLQPRHFSFNHKKGMCQECQGIGYHIIDLQFLPSVHVTCEGCKGYRLSPISLKATYKDKHLGQILEFTIEEAFSFFDILPKVRKKLQMLIDVGLGYLKLNQDIATLSGGEAQRLKLGKELSKGIGKNTLYLIDEPTIGLHPDDIGKLIPLFHRLVDNKNTLIIIEHNTDLLSQADHLIELGPEAGDKGGYIIGCGTIKDFSKNKKSLIDKYLAKD